MREWAGGWTSACRFFHVWGPWSNYEVVRPARCIGPSLRHVRTVAETRRRRRCRRCGESDDRLVAERPVEASRGELRALV